MPSIPKGSLVLVTGVNGYIASHICEQLLQHGYRVRGTARDQYKADYMHRVFDAYGKEAFEVQLVPDMAAEGAFDRVVKSCSGVVHVATDLTLDPNPNLVIPGVVAGTRNALVAAAREASVQRFVYTSSSSAATSALTTTTPGHVDAETWNDADVEAAWAPPPYEGHARQLAVYAASKTLAERECWRFLRDEQPGFVLNTVLPNCNIGRILAPEQPASTGGWYRDLWHSYGCDEALQQAIVELLHQFPPQHFVNVTDTAVLHLAALVEDDVVGERILAFAGPFNFNDTVEIIEKLDAQYGHGHRVYRRIADCPRDLKTVDTARALELLRRFGRPSFTDLETSLREAVLG